MKKIKYVCNLSSPLRMRQKVTETDLSLYSPRYSRHQNINIYLSACV